MLTEKTLIRLRKFEGCSGLVIIFCAKIPNLLVSPLNASLDDIAFPNWDFSLTKGFVPQEQTNNDKVGGTGQT